MMKLYNTLLEVDFPFLYKRLIAMKSSTRVTLKYYLSYQFWWIKTTFSLFSNVLIFLVVSCPAVSFRTIFIQSSSQSVSNAIVISSPSSTFGVADLSYNKRRIFSILRYTIGIQQIRHAIFKSLYFKVPGILHPSLHSP